MADQVHQNVLIVSRDSQLIRLALEVLAGNGIRGQAVGDVGSATDRTREQEWDLVLIDPARAEGDGFELLAALKVNWPELPVVMIGAQADPPERRHCRSQGEATDGRDPVRLAVRAMREGCEDFLPRPVEREAVKSLIETLLPNHEVPLAAGAEDQTRCLYQIVGKSPELLETIRLAGKVAPTSVPVLVTGESGTGKELIAYYLHRQSSRRRGPYVQVNCVALSESLLESELFGHERGAFTGAIAQRKGRFEMAHGGTLLLDEIAETGRRLQAKLLRVLEQQDFERVGGSESVRVNVRVIATSNRNLAAEVRAGRFRLDLYYRINGVHLTMPPLRQRTEDIPLLVWHFVNLYAREVRRHVAQLDPKMLELFCRCRWPGNVRQLRNAVRTALILGQGRTLSLAGPASLQAELLAGESTESECLSLQDLERRAIFEALRRTNRHQAKAARLLGITDRTLREKLRRYRRDGEARPADGDPLPKSLSEERPLRVGEDRWVTELA